MKHLDRRKTDLHRFLDPFTLLAIEGKTIYIYISAVSEDDPNPSRALYYANINVIEAQTVSDGNADRKEIAR